MKTLKSSAVLDLTPVHLGLFCIEKIVEKIGGPGGVIIVSP